MDWRLTYFRHMLLDELLFSGVAGARVDDQSDDSESVERRRAAWMAAAQMGDRLAYERVLADSVALARVVARRCGVRGALLDDVVQETLLSVHRARHTYDPSRSFDAWLAALASRRAVDALRQQGRRSRREVNDDDAWERHAGEGDASTQAEKESQRRVLHEAVATLPPGQREAVEAALHEASIVETAERTGRSTGALKVNLHRALKALRARLNGDS